LAVYSTILTTCYQYSQSTESVSIFESDYYILITQTKIVTSYTQVTVAQNVTSSSTVEAQSLTSESGQIGWGIEVEVSN